MRLIVPGCDRVPDCRNSFKMASILVYKKLVKKGAESYIHDGIFLGREILIKERRPKPYRHSELDARLRKSRIKAEIKVLRSLKDKSIKVPSVLAHDALRFAFAMGKISGDLLHEVLANKGEEECTRACEKLGEQTGMMHQQNIYHGDLTPYNVIVDAAEGMDVYLIDFGLAGFSHDIEKYASDLLVLQQTLEGLFPRKHRSFFDSFKRGYTAVFKEESDSFQIYQKMEKILLRGRYVSRKKRKEAGMI
ncbi:MAG: KEOPS complex kinase/ATPase Bud32 [Candidatus Odinarchaeota archaeon]